MPRPKAWYKRLYFRLQAVPGLGSVITVAVRCVLMSRKLRVIDRMRDEVQQLSLALEGLRRSQSERAGDADDARSLAQMMRVMAGAMDGIEARLRALEEGRSVPSSGIRPADAVGLRAQLGAAFGEPPEKPSVSVVINTFNRAATLGATLEGLRQLRYPDFEVIVVNGPSSDETEQVIAGAGPDVTALSCPEANLSMSRNIGIAAARGDIVAFIDDDAVPEPDWLDRLTTAFADRGVGAAGGFTRDNSGVAFQCKVVVADRFGDNTQYESLEDAGIEDRPGHERFISTTGTNAAFRRDALLAMGGFDEEYAYFLDETDVNVRMMDAGWRCAMVPEAEVHHKYAPSHLRDENRVARSKFIPVRSKAYFVHRHAGAMFGSGRAVEYLGDYLKREAGHLAWGLKHGELSQQRFDQLSREVEDGVAAGVRDAHAPEAPRLLSADTLNAHRERSYRRFPPRRPAEDRLRLVFLSQAWGKDTDSGIAVWTRQAAEGLAARGHEVSVITRSPHGRHTVDFETGVWVHRIQPEGGASRQFPPLPDLPGSLRTHCIGAFDEAMRIRLRRGLDVVSGPIWDVEPMGVLAAGSIPLVVSVHTTAALALPHKPDWLDRPDFRTNHVNRVIAAETRMLAQAPHLLANSKALVRDVETAHGLSLEPARVTVVPHGLTDIPAFDRGGRPPRESVHVVFVGRLEHRKGADVLLSELPALMASLPELRVSLVGDDTIPAPDEPLRTAFERKNGHAPWMTRVSFAGTLERNALLDVYCDADIVVVPSRYESFGLVVIEALRAGAAVIASDIGGIAEILDQEGTGVLVPPGDGPSLARVVRALVKDPERRLRLGRAGRRLFETRYTAATMIDGLEMTYAAAARRSIRGRCPQNQSGPEPLRAQGSHLVLAQPPLAESA
ncbi:MAG: glycosyltransferase [Alphaproteobacteria bacterium]